MIAHDGLVYPSLGLATLVPVLGIRSLFSERLAAEWNHWPSRHRCAHSIREAGCSYTSVAGSRPFPYLAAMSWGISCPRDRSASGSCSRHLCPRARRQRCQRRWTRHFRAWEVHADVADSILRRDFIRRSPAAPAIEHCACSGRWPGRRADGR